MVELSSGLSRRSALALLIVLGWHPGAFAAEPVVPNPQTAALLRRLLQPKGSAPGGAPAAAPPIINAIVNAGSFEQNALAPGSLLTLFIGNSTVPFTAVADSAPLPVELAGVSVKVNGAPIPILFASPTQVNAQLPYEIAAGPNNTAVLTTGTAASAAVSFAVTAAAPGILNYQDNGVSVAVAQNTDATASLITAANPAPAGSYVVIYLVGCGAMDNPVGTGNAAPATVLSRAVAQAVVTIGRFGAPLAFLGLTPGFVGLCQANVQIPSPFRPGAYPVKFTIGGWGSNSPMIFTR